MRQQTTRFQSVIEVTRRLSPSYPIFCIFPDVIEATAREFVAGFPGTVLYAVKCNPEARILRALNRAGINNFDTASLSEIAKVTELLPDARCYFNHPVKGRAALDAAIRVYGLKDYVVDHISELDKLTSLAGTDITVEVRLATPKGSAVYDLSSKFGALPDDAVALLKEANKRGMRTAVAFHVGSQCPQPQAYSVAMTIAADVIQRAEVPLEYLNVGGGFPAAFTAPVPPLADYFSAIKVAAAHLELDVPLIAEPGRALVAEGCSVLTQVHLRKGNSLYINDGIYGSLNEVWLGNVKPPVNAIGRQRALSTSQSKFQIFGPTCDSLDVFKTLFRLPKDIAEGDWIEFCHMGAYSIGMQTSFNGFTTDAIVEVTTPSVDR
jgi:ornithine decarboxylase